MNLHRNTVLRVLPGKTGRGLPQSKSLRDRRSLGMSRQVLECASPSSVAKAMEDMLALWLRSVWRTSIKTFEVHGPNTCEPKH
jgi:hypothetical protein